LPPSPPPELAPFFLDLDWDEARLWQLRLRVGRIRTAELEWHLDLPWWRDNGGPFAVTPRDVLADPRRHPEQYARTLNADLRFPLHITRHHGRWTIMDGIHRLAKAVLLELERVPAKRVPRSAYRAIEKRSRAA